jgi:hypothetical protein
MLEEKVIEATLNQVLAQPGWGAWRVERFHLQDERHGADYDVARKFTRAEAQVIVGRAEAI